RQLGFQEIDIVAMVQSVTKYAVTITDPNSIAWHLDKAIHLAKSGRPGPVWIDIPLDVQAASIDPLALPRYTPEPTAVQQADLYEVARKTLQLLSQSERPILMAGNGIRTAKALEQFQHLIEVLQIPVQTTWLSLDFITDDHPLFAGRPGVIAPRGANFALQNCDFFLSIGTRIDMFLSGYAHHNFARAAHKVVCDIDEAEIQKLKMTIDIPVVADARDFMQALIDVAPEFPQPDRREWLDRITRWKARYPLAAPIDSKKQQKISAYTFSNMLSDEIPEDALIAPGSSGFACEIFLLMLKIKKGQRCFHNHATGAMGLAPPAAIGACFAANKKTVISVDGDGGFQLNIQELATIAAHHLPIKFFIINNNGYASIRASQNNYFAGNKVACDDSSGLQLPDVVRIATAYGITAEKLNQTGDMRAQIRRILASKDPVVCEVDVIPDEPRIPRLSTAQRKDGSVVSKPLEDLFPFLDRDEFAENMLISMLIEETQ
ncbi:MAG: thiamine pyrophosphate-binding protein, partial [Verrucomicrobia bacterium RIFCSPHIGHO2_12_FULL_41_10]